LGVETNWNQETGNKNQESREKIKEI